MLKKRKKTGLLGSILSVHRMNTAFGPFELPRIRALYMCTYAEMDKDEVFSLQLSLKHQLPQYTGHPVYSNLLAEGGGICHIHSVTVKYTEKIAVLKCFRGNQISYYRDHSNPL